MNARLDLQRPIDLLRERRQELALPEPGRVRRSQRRDLLQGGLWAAGLVALVAAVGVAVSLRQQWVSAELERVALLEARVTSLDSDLTVRRQQLLRQRAANETLAKALAATPSGAALMRELQLRVPEGIQLTAVKTQAGSSISLEGLAWDPGSFVRINALMLELGRSRLIREPKLEKAARNPADAKQGSGQVAFAIRAALLQLADAPALESDLRELGADGQLRRLQLLRREGLLP